MDDPQFQQHGGPHPSPRPHRRPLHHSPFFWVAAVFILFAMTVFVLTNNLAFIPGRNPRPLHPVLAP